MGRNPETTDHQWRIAQIRASLETIHEARKRRTDAIVSEPPVRVPTDSGVERAAELGAAISHLMDGEQDG